MDTHLVANGVHSPQFVVIASPSDSSDRASRPLELGLYGVEVVSPQEELARTGWSGGFLLVHADRELRRAETGDVIAFLSNGLTSKERKVEVSSRPELGRLDVHRHVVKLCGSHPETIARGGAAWRRSGRSL